MCKISDITIFSPITHHFINTDDVKTLTLDHHLVTGNQYLLAVAGLRVLEDGGSRLGCCCVGHGQSLKSLDSICTVISQLNSPALCDCNCVFGERDRCQREKGNKREN